MESLSEWAANYEIKLNYRKTVSPAVKMFLVAFSCLHCPLFVNFASLISREWRIHAFGGPARRIFTSRSFVNGSLTDSVTRQSCKGSSGKDKRRRRVGRLVRSRVGEGWRSKPADFEVMIRKMSGMLKSILLSVLWHRHPGHCDGRPSTDGRLVDWWRLCRQNKKKNSSPL